MKHIIKLVTYFVDVCRCLGLCLRTFVSIRVPPRGVCSCSVRWDLANLSSSTWGWEGARTPPYLRRSFASRLRSSLAGRLRAIPRTWTASLFRSCCRWWYRPGAVESERWRKEGRCKLIKDKKKRSCKVWDNFEVVSGISLKTKERQTKWRTRMM